MESYLSVVTTMQRIINVTFKYSSIQKYLPVVGLVVMSRSVVTASVVPIVGAIVGSFV